MSDKNDPMDLLEKALEGACDTLTTIAGTVLRFSYEEQDLLFTKVNDFVKDLRAVDNASKHVTAMVPMEVIEAIDKGRNPELTTYEMLEDCAKENNVARGKLQVMRLFRDALQQAAEADPDTKDEAAQSMPTTDATNGF